MLNTKLNLNKKVFDNNVELVSMRAGFGEGIMKAAKIDRNIVALCADLTESLQLDKFKKKYPDRFIEIGVAEQNLVTVASGMAASGKIPFVGSYAVFSPGRNWEQIRTTVCYNNLPVKIIGSHAGITVGPDGGSHQALEDIALMRTLPRMVVISPCDAIEARKATEAAAKTTNPTYIRLARDKTPLITTDDTPFEIGKAQIVFNSARLGVISEQQRRMKGTCERDWREHEEFPSKEISVPLNPSLLRSTTPTIKASHQCDVGIIATGPSLYRALKVAKKLGEEGKAVQVMNLSTIKPLDEIAVVAIARECGAIVTVEDHQVAGGMGSAIAECLAKHFPVHMEFIGIHDQFGQSGTPIELTDHYKMNEKDIHRAAQRAMLRK